MRSLEYRDLTLCAGRLSAGAKISNFVQLTTQAEKEFHVRTTVLAAILLSVPGMPTAQAAESEWQIAPRAFIGDLDVKREYTIDDAGRADPKLAGWGGSLGYLTPMGIVVAIGGDYTAEPDFFGSAFDNYSLSQAYAAVGYQFELGEGWRFVPMVGRVRWRLEGEQGAFLNPGPEEVEVMRGYDYYWEASVSRRISRVVALGIAYKQGDCTFGKSSSAAFMVTIGL